jgi:membrane protease subunit HflK
MIDAKTSNQIYLPLDRMLSQSVANEAALGSRSGPVMPPVAPAQQGAANQPAPPASGTVTVNGSSAQPQPQAPAQAQATPPADAVRKADSRSREPDPRSRETSRDRETR